MEKKLRSFGYCGDLVFKELIVYKFFEKKYNDLYLMKYRILIVIFFNYWYLRIDFQQIFCSFNDISVFFDIYVINF